MTRFLVFWKAWGGDIVYKHYAAWHLVQMAGAHGIPLFYLAYAE